MWGSVDGWRDAQVRRAEGEVLGGGTLPGAPASCEVDGVGVGVDDGVIGVSALGLTRGGDVEMDGKTCDDDDARRGLT